MLLMYDTERILADFRDVSQVKPAVTYPEPEQVSARRATLSGREDQA